MSQEPISNRCSKRKLRSTLKRKLVNKEENEGLSNEIEESPPSLPNVVQHNLHNFTPSETKMLISNILDFYDSKKRDLPWRRYAENKNLSIRAYGVLVSEIMLQQTQVATVKTYYERWIARWPTFDDLAKASLEEVNEMWAGLGYYGRARRLFEASKKIVSELNGKVPESAVELQQSLPGVGRYTAGAVASIAYGQRVAAVDGNVIRVVSRMRVIGGDTSLQGILKEIWNIVEDIVVNTERPGDFNQALMELGATICTPKTPKCSSCPVNTVCLAYKTTKAGTIITLKTKNNGEKEINDIENLPGCLLCLPETEPWDLGLGVMNFPRKSKKAPPRKQETVVGILQRKGEEDKYLLMKRPSVGLLANLWEFPSFILDVHSSTSDPWIALQDKLQENLCFKKHDIKKSEHIGNVTHIFSHIHQLYIVYSVQISNNAVACTPNCYQEQQWVTKDQLLSSAISTGMKKIFHSYNNLGSQNISLKRARSTSISSKANGNKNAVITDFFTNKSKKL